MLFLSIYYSVPILFFHMNVICFLLIVMEADGEQDVKAGNLLYFTSKQIYVIHKWGQAETRPGEIWKVKGECCDGILDSHAWRPPRLLGIWVCSVECQIWSDKSQEKFDLIKIRSWLPYLHPCVFQRGVRMLIRINKLTFIDHVVCY